MVIPEYQMIEAGLTFATVQIDGGFVGPMTINQDAVSPTAHMYCIRVEAMIEPTSYRSL